LSSCALSDDRAFRTPGRHFRIRASELERFQAAFGFGSEGDEGPKVLVIDDQQDFVDLAHDALKELLPGATIEGACGGYEALLKIGSPPAFMTVAHALSFPGLFSPTGLLGAGAQSTAWLYMFWHVGFPLLVIAYTRLEISRGDASGGPGRPSFAILGSAAVSFVVAGGFTLLATAGQGPLPAIMEDNRNRIVFVIGDILSREKREFLERTGAPHVLKPFDLREVRQLVHRMLAETGTGGSPGRH